MNATRKHENIAEYSDVNGGNRSPHVNLEWISKLRSKKGERRKNNTHIQAPVRFQDQNQEDKKSRSSIKSLNRDYSEKDIPQVYYKKNRREDRFNKNENDYKGNFSDIQHLTKREVLGKGQLDTS